MDSNNMEDEYSTNNTESLLQIQNLKVWIPEEWSWWRRKTVKPKTVILNEISGCIRQGEFVALLGPSGAGKTTFLVSLAGKCTLPSEGSVEVNNTNVRDIARGVVDIVPQFEVFMDSLSVIEHLVFMTEMKVGSSKKANYRRTLNSLIVELKLKAHIHTPIKSLSGGERRLLSLASSLLSNPQILICDEPTTGLDSYSAALVVGVLKRIALLGKTVICSVHQPSSDLFKEFTSIILMAEGKILFHGAQEECKLFFESLNLHCPKNYNPAEFYIRTVSSRSLRSYVEGPGKDLQPRMREKTGPIYPTQPLAQCKIYHRNWCSQVFLLIWRSSLTLKRDLKDHIIQLAVGMMISSIIISTCYVGISGTTQRGIQDLSGFLWLISSEVSYSLAYNALYVFENELTLFRREVGMYSASAYFVSRFMTIIPRCVIWPIMFVIVATLAVDLPNHILTAFEFIVTLIAAAVASTAYGLGMGALFTSTGIIGDIMPCADLPLFLMSGAFLRISSLPYWLYPVKYVSHFYYVMDAISNIYWRQIPAIYCPANSTTKCAKDGTAVLLESGYSENFILEDSYGLLFVTILWSLLAYYGLKREERKGYAY